MISTYHGDITKLNVECIVNAANEQGLGCFVPNHPCIDNAIHRAAGPELTNECHSLTEITPNVRIPTGTARITHGYQLPARYVIHATGPSTRGGQPPNYDLLAQTYVSALELAWKCGIRQIAFCCISTGLFGHNKSRSCVTAIQTVSNWLRDRKKKDAEEAARVAAGTPKSWDAMMTGTLPAEVTMGRKKDEAIHVIFVTYTDEDRDMYRNLLYGNQKTAQDSLATVMLQSVPPSGGETKRV